MGWTCSIHVGHDNWIYTYWILLYLGMLNDWQLLRWCTSLVADRLETICQKKNGYSTVERLLWNLTVRRRRTTKITPSGCPMLCPRPEGWTATGRVTARSGQMHAEFQEEKSFLENAVKTLHGRNISCLNSSSYRAINTVRLSYTNQSVNAV